MSDYYISQIRPDDKPANQQLDLLLSSEGIRRDANLDYTCGMFDEEMNLVARRQLLWQYTPVPGCRPLPPG